MTAPVVDVAGVKPVLPELKEATPALAIEIVPAPGVIEMPVPAVRAAAVYVVPLPIGTCPIAGTVDIPRPPLETARVPARVTAPVVGVAGVKPVLPELKEVTPVLAIEMDPAPGVMEMPVPAVNEATTGAELVDPIRI